jgi:Protein of unknown function (DUF1552)
MSRLLSRRALLRGAGVALALPWLPSLLPRRLSAQAADLPRRFLPIFLPNGASELWRPAQAGRGDAWKLTSVLEPFGAALKGKLSIVTNLENQSVFNTDGASIEPSHSRLAGAWLSCVDATKVRAQLASPEANGITVDQVLAQHATFKHQTTLASLQVGLSTPLGSCDGEPCSSTRSISWASSTQPMYKLVDPLEIFERMVGVVQPLDPTEPAALEARKRVQREQSVLDAVQENAERTRARLGTSDQRRMDEFLESVRAVERRVTGVSAGMGGLACTTRSAPTLARVEQSALAPRQTTENYDKGQHADAVNDLIVMAFECDVTRIVSYMLEDERSEFTYDHVEERTFTEDSSTPKGGPCPEYHLAQHAGGDVFASITWWNVGKVADLCRKLDAIAEAPGVSVLDNCVVMLGACMHGGNHLATELPLALVGGGNLGLQTDQHLVLEERPLRDLYVTLLRDVYGADVADFGQHVGGVPPATITELLKT